MPRVSFRMPIFFESVDAMIVTTGPKTTVSLCVAGEPIAQPRIRFRRILRAFRVIPYDPSYRQKMAFRAEVARAINDVGASVFPLFGSTFKLKVTVTFHVFDARKDIDNLLKFFLDAIQGVVFKNDSMVFEIVATKVRVSKNLQYTGFEVENIVEE